ncbi:hypothetical protein EJ04DRAFT_558844 [Polyplosphaeria fusca]|uniref:Uncharacterized protein n=1 Tax=Polyplosphaeria fusca TaxID=682080 RepID=A0A9P4R901_9PLEO|nr:hypothetical protein EJ04DRAFT_558844 [Polyplosphaeria fusca]
MKFTKSPLLFLGALTPLVNAFCITVYGSGQTGFGVLMTLNVERDGNLICQTDVGVGAQGSIPCGDGHHFEWNWNNGAGPWPATYVSDGDIGISYEVQMSGDNGGTWSCDITNCCGGNIPCACDKCWGSSEACWDQIPGVIHE